MPDTYFIPRRHRHASCFGGTPKNLNGMGRKGVCIATVAGGSDIELAGAFMQWGVRSKSQRSWLFERTLRGLSIGVGGYK